MSKTVSVQCENPKCRVWFDARVADRKRGWARTCCKSCASVLRIMETDKENMFSERKEK